MRNYVVNMTAFVQFVATEISSASVTIPSWNKFHARHDLPWSTKPPSRRLFISSLHKTSRKFNQKENIFLFFSSCFCLWFSPGSRFGNVCARVLKIKLVPAWCWFLLLVIENFAGKERNFPSPSIIQTSESRWAHHRWANQSGEAIKRPASALLKPYCSHLAISATRRRKISLKIEK